MTELGITAYPDISPMDKIKDYFKLASQFGFTRVTSSMLSVEGTNDEILAYFKELNEIAHTFGMTVCLDVNTNLLARLHQSYDNISAFHKICCDCIRLDGSYGAEHDYIMTQNPYGIKIEMNASSANILNEIDFLSNKKVNREQIQLCHNFYPQRYTGLKWIDFVNKNKALKPYGYKIAAFVSSNAANSHGPWNSEDGLPTVENLRDLPIDLQVRILLSTQDVNDVIIGNAYASEEELKAISEIIKEPKSFVDSPVFSKIKAYGPILPKFGPCKRLKVILEKNITHIEKENLLDIVPQLDNGDSSEWIWRSRSGRLINKDRFIPPRKYEGTYFPAGSIVIVNDINRHYSGEIQIVKLPILNDGKRNLIARLAPDEEYMLELIDKNDLVEFFEYHTY